MKDIRVRHKHQRAQEPQPAKKPDLSFLRAASGPAKKPVRSIEAPPRSKGRLQLTVLVALIFLSLGIFIGNYLSWPVTDNNLSLPKGATLETAESSGLFETDIFYRVELLNDSFYYAHVAKAGNDHYRLAEIFYTTPTPEGVAGLEAPERITLVKYGTEAFEPADELILPRAQVRAITPLQESSPIVEAIQEYLINN